jgi:hypothetical protein
VPAHLETCSYADEFIWRSLTTLGKAELPLTTVTAKAFAHSHSTRAAHSVAPAVHKLDNRLGRITIATRNPYQPLHADDSHILFSPAICHSRCPEKTARLPQWTWHRQFARPSHHISYARKTGHCAPEHNKHSRLCLCATTIFAFWTDIAWGILPRVSDVE